MNTVRVLITDSAQARQLTRPLLELLQTSLSSATVHPVSITQPDSRDFWATVGNSVTDIVLVILARDGLGRLVAALQQRADHSPRPPVIAVLDDGAPHELAALLEAGAVDYIMPPLTAAQVVPRLLRALARFLPRSASQPIAPYWTAQSMDQLIGRSPSFLAERNKIPLIANCDASVLIDGETGTGKEMFARAIHDLGPRAGLPFVPVNCGAIPVELAESELFGHERGAFTGAYAAQKGLIAQADGGTLFLDEVASLPLLTQVKLLRFLQEKEYRPVGAALPRRADVRIVAAANTNLTIAIQKGQFRQDLYYRLNVIRVSLPPLRQRRDDIPILADFFLRKWASRMGADATGIDPVAGETLLRHNWPGNVRELENVIERAVVFARSPVVRADQIVFAQTPEHPAADSFKAAKARTVAEFERSYIEGLLAVHHGNISRAARRAGKNRRAFWELMRKHDVAVERFRAMPTAEFEL